MTTRIYHHAVFARHDTGAGHPESADRVRAIETALRRPEFAALDWQEAPPASHAQLERVHPRAHVQRILAAVPSHGHQAVDPDTWLSPDSGEAALRAAGAACAGVDAVLDGTADNAFCIVRPPGHHAERERSMGFCLFNNVAVAAAHAQSRGIKRLAIVDFDVHHGNGTQDIAERHPDWLFVSTHQSPLYPGTGHRDERGGGNLLNLPLPPMSDGRAFRRLWHDIGLPAVDDHEPELILVSAGFDAHVMDPLAGLALEDEDYAWISREIVALAKRHCGGRVVSSLEGGYQLEALASSASAHVQALLEG